MTQAPAGKLQPSESKRTKSPLPAVAVVASDKLARSQVRAADNPKVLWDAAFAVYGDHGASQSSTIVYEIEPGGELGWHTDS